jgi:hypothetical protein
MNAVLTAGAIAVKFRSTSAQDVQACSDCDLGVQQAPLLASQSHSLDGVSSSAFQKTPYSVVSPLAYSMEATDTRASLPVSSCPSCPLPAFPCGLVYTIQDGDSCNYVARNHDISTFGLLYANDLDVTCDNFPAAGTSLCIPDSQCATHQVTYGETCADLIKRYGALSITNLVTWCGRLLFLQKVMLTDDRNPNINSLCTDLDELAGSYICVRYVCSISRFAGMNLTGCSAPGSRAERPQPSTPYLVATADAAQQYVFQMPTLAPNLPLAPGTIADCYMYRNQQERADTRSMSKPGSPSRGSFCRHVIGSYAVSLDQLVSWNPSLTADEYECMFTPGFRYCMLRKSDDAIKCKQIVVEPLWGRD